MVKGLPWTLGGISNAVYKGVLVRDWLLDLGFTEEYLNDKHLVAFSLD